MADLTTLLSKFLNGLYTGVVGSGYAITAFIFGAESTSGVRLDLESGDLAVREGDDSGYANLKVNDLTVAGTLTGGATGDVVGPSSSVDNEIVRYDSTTGKLVQAYTSGGPTVGDTGDAVFQGAFVINEAGGDKDTRIEGDTDVNLFFVDASTDRVGIGTNAPSTKLHISGNAIVTGLVHVGGDTSSFVALKRSGTDLLVRLGDDSNMANIVAANILRGTGSPEGVQTAPVGALYQRTDGGASTTLYVKESGAGNTGWVAK